MTSFDTLYLIQFCYISFFKKTTDHDPLNSFYKLVMVILLQSEYHLSLDFEWVVDLRITLSLNNYNLFSNRGFKNMS